MKKYPQKSSSHQAELESVNYFKSMLPKNWDAFPPELDYGVDLIVNLFHGDDSTGHELLVQLKASELSQATSDGKFERISMKVSTYNMLAQKLQVVMVVKYVVEEKKAYWQLLSQVDEPNQNRKTMTIRIPKDNVFSESNWKLVQRYVDHIQYEKLKKTDRVNLQDFA
ncbi:DUF4365 domain-containing protein [Vibrio owensii]|uniref:DUF4365 domain-containing protein n=1 Tax=Vibrio owensii TaxID=696485 RepID=UPI003AAE77D2